MAIVLQMDFLEIINSAGGAEFWRRTGETVAVIVLRQYRGFVWRPISQHAELFILKEAAKQVRLAQPPELNIPFAR